MAAPITVSFSELQTARHCPLKHQLSYHERWVKDPDLMSPLSKGTAWHMVLEAHYKVIKAHQDAAQRLRQTWDTAETWAACKETVAGLIEDELAPRGDELADLIRWMYAGHLAAYGLDEQWRVLAVEHQAVCRLPLPNGKPSRFKLKMKIDLVVGQRTPRGHPQIHVVDHKTLDDDTHVVTYGGKTRLGDVEAGDQVLGSDGAWTLVTAVTRSSPECYRIRLRNGTELVCSDRHRWPVERIVRPGQYQYDVLTTAELIDEIGKGVRYRMISAPAVRRPDKRLPLDPYLVGAVLGDGGLTRRTASFTKGHKPTVDRVLAALPVGTEVTSVGQHPSKAPTYWFGGTINQELKALGLLDIAGSQKFIPAAYLTGSFEQRLELLRGLMDTDGSHRKGVPLYQTGSERLAHDVRRLVESLGGTATVWVNRAPKHQNGRGAPNWEVKMRFPRDFPVPYHHAEKAVRYKPSHKTLGERLVIESIEPVGPRACTDLEVSAEDSLFAVEGVLTHNSCRNLPKDKELDLDDQFGLYTWGMRQIGKKVFGQIHDAARTERLVKEAKAWNGDTDEPYEPGAVQPLADRFKRTPMYRTDEELNTIAVEAYLSAKARYQQQREADKAGYDSPRHTDPQTCRYLCDFTDPCLAGRKGVDLRGYLEAKGFQRDHTRH